ncbi:hypothetical protein D0T57_13125 [Dysgonomonas sp. 511]|nr:hypothetical protein [Dysgonomonas sp. 511]
MGEKVTGKNSKKVLHVLLFYLTPRSLQRERGLQATTREREKVTMRKRDEKVLHVLLFREIQDTSGRVNELVSYKI